MSTFTFENGNQIYQRTRLQIGPLYLSAQSYEARSTIDSKEYVSSGPITSISFTADEAFPEEYSTEDTPLDASAFITYSLIIGTGEYKITPSNRGGSDPFKYYINSELLEDARQVLKTVTTFFPLRTSKMLLDGKKIYRPCLNFQMKK